MENVRRLSDLVDGNTAHLNVLAEYAISASSI